MIHEILRPFFNTSTVNDKHYLPKRHNLTQPIQIELSQKQNIFSEFFFPLEKSMLNFKHLQKKDEPHSRRISGNTGSDKYG